MAVLLATAKREVHDWWSGVQCKALGCGSPEVWQTKARSSSPLSRAPLMSRGSWSLLQLQQQEAAWALAGSSATLYAEQNGLWLPVMWSRPTLPHGGQGHKTCGGTVAWTQDLAAAGVVMLCNLNAAVKVTGKAVVLHSLGRGAWTASGGSLDKRVIEHCDRRQTRTWRR